MNVDLKMSVLYEIKFAFFGLRISVLGEVLLSPQLSFPNVSEICVVTGGDVARVRSRILGLGDVLNALKRCGVG